MKNNKRITIIIVALVIVFTASVCTIWSSNRTDKLQKGELAKTSKTYVTGKAGEEPEAEITTQVENTTEPETTKSQLAQATTEKTVEKKVTVKNKVSATTTKKVTVTEKKTEKKTVPTTVEKKVTVTEKAIEKKTVPTTVAKNVVATTQSVTKKKTVEATTKKTVETTTKKTVTKKNTETTTKAKKQTGEYYSSLTASDMEEAKQYCIEYIRKKGYTVESRITWNNSTWGAKTGICDNLAVYGEEFKVKNGGMTPLEWVKKDLKEGVDSEIWEQERCNGKGSVSGVYPLIVREGDAWYWAVGIWN